MQALKLRIVLLVLGFLSAVPPSAAFQSPQTTLTEFARLSAVPFGADSTRALGALMSLLLIAGSLLFLLRKRTAAIVNKFIAWVNRTGAIMGFLGILLLAFALWRPRIFIFTALIAGVAHIFSIPLWPGSAPARPTRGYVQTRYRAPACGQSATAFPVSSCGRTIG